jgi:hypothetical protein
MAWNKLIAWKSTGKAPHYRLAFRGTCNTDTFLEEFGMPTLLWRVLRAAGYPEGMEPRYFWNEEQLGEAVLVNVEVVVEARDNHSTWNGSHARSKGTTPAEGASRAAFMVLSEIMDDHP